MTDSSRAGLAGAAGSCPRPPRLPPSAASPACCWERPWERWLPLPLPGRLCPHPLPRVGPRHVRGPGGAAHTMPSSGCPQLLTARANIQRKTKHSSVGSGTAATPEHSARAAVPGRGLGRAATDKVQLSGTSAPRTHPYLTSIPTSPPSLPLLRVRCVRPPLTARSERGAPAAGGWPCSACLLTCCFPR